MLTQMGQSDERLKEGEIEALFTGVQPAGLQGIFRQQQFFKQIRLGQLS